MKNKLGWVVRFVLSVVLLIVFSSFQLSACAEEFNNQGFVDDFKLPEKTKSEDPANIEVYFSSKLDYQVKPNDTLTLTIPEHLYGVAVTGIPVVGKDNVQYGTMEVKSGVAIIRFNQNVENYKTLEGELSIPVKASLDADDPNVINYQENGRDAVRIEGKSNLGTDLPDKGYIVWNNVYKPGEGPAKMFYKTGSVKDDYEWDTIEYRVHVKAEEYDVQDNIFFTDTLGEYQFFPSEEDLMTPQKLEFMEINYISEANGYENQFTIQEFESEGYGTFQFTSDNSFEMTFDKDKANGFMIDIYYRVRLTDIAKTVKPEFVRNDIVETYHLKDSSEPITELKNAVVPVTYPDATARPGKGILWIIKKKQIGDTAWSHQDFLPGVKFDIYHEDDTLVVGGENLITDIDGRIILPDLLPGNYYAREIDAPEDVLFDSEKKYEFKIDENSKYGVILAISNKAILPKGEFTATKEASEQVLKPGEKFTYTITVTNTVEGSILKNLLVEDNMPDGIQIDGNLRLNGEAVDEIIGNGFKVTIPELKGNEIATIKVDAVVKEDASESKPVNIAKITDPEDPDNPKEPPAEVEIIRETDLRLLKTGMDGKTVLKDAVFELYQLVDGKEELLLSYTTDNVGHINFTKLKSGTYIIKEKIAPNGYQLLEESITLTIDKKGIPRLVDSLKGMVSLDKVANEFQLTIKNEEEPTKGILPQTGGNGHLGYTKTALLLMIIGSSLFGYYWYRSRKGWQS